MPATEVIRLCLAALALWLAPIAASAQQDFSNLNEWRVLCDPDGACQIRNQQRTGRGADSQILVYRIGQAEIVEFKTPLGLDLRKGVVLLVDRRQRFATDLLTCKAEGCVGFAPMTTELLRALAGGSELEVVWTDNDTDRQQSYAFSLVGFVRSYNTFFEQ